MEERAKKITGSEETLYYPIFLSASQQEMNRYFVADFLQGIEYVIQKKRTQTKD